MTDSRLALYDEQMRRNHPDHPCRRVERTETVTRIIGEDFGCVLWSRLDAANADAAIEAQVTRFGSEGRAFEWKLFSHDTPADLGDRLYRLGFRQGDKEELLCYSLETPLVFTLPADITLSKLAPGDDHSAGYLFKWRKLPRSTVSRSSFPTSTGASTRPWSFACRSIRRKICRTCSRESSPTR